MRVHWKPCCQDVSLHSVNLLLPFFNPHIHPPRPPLFVPSSSFVSLSLQNSWPSLELLPLRCRPSVGCRASSTSRCELLLPSTWAWRCVWGVALDRRTGDLDQGRVCIDTKEDNKGEQWCGWTPGRRWGGSSGWLTVSMQTHPSVLCEGSVELCKKKSLRGYILNMWRIMMQQPEHPRKMIIYSLNVFSRL